eukprot:gene8577-10279_t
MTSFRKVTITLALVTFIVTLTFKCTEATYGADVSTATSQSALSCLRGNGYSFAIARCFRSTGTVDPNCPQTIINAWNAGLTHVDIYLFPRPTAGNPAAQIDALVNFLNQQGIKPRGQKPKSYGMLWLDIEGPQYWTSSQTENRNFFSGLVSQAKAHGIPLGVYTSASQWNPIMGDWSGGSAFPLWYAHYDGSASFSDFKPFGGWSKPSIKQYAGTTNVCGASIDKNWLHDNTYLHENHFNKVPIHIDLQRHLGRMSG